MIKVLHERLRKINVRSQLRPKETNRVLAKPSRGQQGHLHLGEDGAQQG